jgi:hypothetical protein
VSEAGAERRLGTLLAAHVLGQSRLIREDEATTIGDIEVLIVKSYPLNRTKRGGLGEDWRNGRSMAIQERDL